MHSFTLFPIFFLHHIDITSYLFFLPTSHFMYLKNSIGNKPYIVLHPSIRHIHQQTQCGRFHSFTTVLFFIILSLFPPKDAIILGLGLFLIPTSCNGNEFSRIIGPVCRHYHCCTHQSVCRCSQNVRIKCSHTFQPT